MSQNDSLQGFSDLIEFLAYTIYRITNTKMKETKVIHFRLAVFDKDMIDLHVLPNNPNLSDFVRSAVKEKLARDLSPKNRIAA